MSAVERRAGPLPRTPDWSHPITLLYDGGCPLCSKETRLLRWLDRGRGRVRFEDICAPGFAPGDSGLDRRAVFERMHGVLPGGPVVEGMEVFRRAYAAVGLGFILAPTRWPGLRTLADGLYRVFARWRLRRRCGGDPCSIADLTPIEPTAQCDPSAAEKTRP